LVDEVHDAGADAIPQSIENIDVEMLLLMLG